MRIKGSDGQQIGIPRLLLKRLSGDPADDKVMIMKMGYTGVQAEDLLNNVKIVRK